MNRLIPILLTAALVAGCSAGQVFGPTLRSACQTQELADVLTKERVAVAVTAPDIAPATKASLKACAAANRDARTLCEANATAGNEGAVGTAVAVMAAETAKCKAILDGGGL